MKEENMYTNSHLKFPGISRMKLSLAIVVMIVSMSGCDKYGSTEIVNNEISNGENTAAST